MKRDNTRSHCLHCFPPPLNGGNDGEGGKKEGKKDDDKKNGREKKKEEKNTSWKFLINGSVITRASTSILSRFINSSIVVQPTWRKSVCAKNKIVPHLRLFHIHLSFTILNRECAKVKSESRGYFENQAMYVPASLWERFVPILRVFI